MSRDDEIEQTELRRSREETDSEMAKKQRISFALTLIGLKAILTGAHSVDHETNLDQRVTLALSKIEDALDALGKAG